jgi:hypothetical protein
MDVKVMSLNCWGIPFSIPGFSSPDLRDLCTRLFKVS